MVKSFTELKHTSQTSFEKLNEEIGKLNQNQFQADDRFWQPTVDKAGNGYAVIRFLPHDPDEEKLPFVRLWDHAFQGPSGLWYIEKSLTSLGEADPVSEHNSVLWQEGKEGQDIVRGVGNKSGTKRRKYFIANIQVLEDDGTPTNNGTTHLFRFGQVIFDFLDSQINPKFKDKVPYDPFNVWNGANFIMRIQKKDGRRNYDECSFAPPGPFASEEVMEKAWNNRVHPLTQFLDRGQFKSYNELKAKLDRVLAGGTRSTSTVEQEKPVPQFKSRPAVQPIEETPPWETTDADDDLSQFQKLVTP